MPSTPGAPWTLTRNQDVACGVGQTVFVAVCWPMKRVPVTVKVDVVRGPLWFLVMTVVEVTTPDVAVALPFVMPIATASTCYTASGLRPVGSKSKSQQRIWL